MNNPVKGFASLLPLQSKVISRYELAGLEPPAGGVNDMF